MPKDDRQERREYRYGKRGRLVCGDRFRVRGGPVYVTDDGRELAMHERGAFIFHRYCVQGPAEWIEAQRVDGGGAAILWVGPSTPSPLTPQLRRRPYRIIRIMN